MRRPSHVFMLLPVLALALARGGVARADGAQAPHAAVAPRHPARAALLRQRGLEHFVNREYQLAADDLMEAYRLDKRAATLFAWAESVRGAGDCELATRIYQRLLDRTAALKLTRQAELGIAACEAAAKEPAANPVTATAPSAATVAIDPAIESIAAADAAADESADAPRAPPAASPEDPHLTSYLVIGGGAAAAVTGLAIYASGGATTAPDATHAEVTSARSSGDWRRLIGASLAVIGGGVTVVGVLRYRSERSRGSGPSLSIAPYIAGGGGGLVLSGSL